MIFYYFQKKNIVINLKKIFIKQFNSLLKIKYFLTKKGRKNNKITKRNI